MLRIKLVEVGDQLKNYEKNIIAKLLIEIALLLFDINCILSCKKQVVRIFFNFC